MKIVCLGDSFTKGFGVKDEECWVSIVNRRLPYEFVNKGISGDTTAGLLSRFHRDVVDEHPRYVLIDAGFNDFLAGADSGSVQANIMALVHQAYHNNIVPIIVMIPGGNPQQFREKWPTYIDINEVRKKYLAYRAWLKNFCKGFSVFYIDCYKEADTPEFQYHNYIDGIHMTPRGHVVIADYIMKFFEEAV